jgi:BirA family biotin operon repressor/biotin-[acetyl-CoA-carboxylase] ligase
VISLARVKRIAETPSTNTLALEAREDGAVFVADAQTGGRGTHGRAWHSAPGLGIWMSVCLRGDPHGLNFAAPLAIRDALAPMATLRIKWPNDLLHEERKICGILVEHRASWSALGIGLNVNHRVEDFPGELRDSATSLRIATGGECDREAVLTALLAALTERLGQWRSGGVPLLYRQWAESCVIMGEPVCRDGIRGTVAGLRPDGALLVRTDAGEIALTGWPAT